MASETTKIRTAKIPKNSTFVGGLDIALEKKRESRMIDPNSPSVAPAITSCPKFVAPSPASFSIGITIPSEVEERIIAISSGEVISPNAKRPNPISKANAKEMTKALPIRIMTRPLNLCRSTSNPERKSKYERPRIDRNPRNTSTCAQFSTCGPIIIPPTISKTTAGRIYARVI
jgi:hypothetical protein